MKVKSVYFIGIGGIGMSALARYYLSNNVIVGGYDKIKTDLTQSLEQEGALIQYLDSIDEISNDFKNTKESLIVYTPAIPSSLEIFQYFTQKGFSLLKRSELLGEITRKNKSLCVAGTHGKTTTASLLTHILLEGEINCNAFLGGIASNYNSNCILSESADYNVVEADEFDRSFLKLSPFSTIITSCDPDHLDIYSNQSIFEEGFKQYSMKSSIDGFSIQKEGLNLPSLSKVLTYDLNSIHADYSLENQRYINGQMIVDFRMKNEFWKNIRLGLPGIHNAENALACAALLHNLEVSESTIRNGIETFLGVKRRFEYQLKTDNLIMIDDYAHHPTEIKSFIDSLLELYPDKKIIAVFQPHLFSRTRDFSSGFVSELSRFDELILLPIYPAREKPIHGISSEWLLQKIRCKKKYLMEPSQVVSYFKKVKKGVVVTIGAGDIDKIVQPIKSILESNL